MNYIPNFEMNEDYSILNVSVSEFNPKDLMRDEYFANIESTREPITIKIKLTQNLFQKNKIFATIQVLFTADIIRFDREKVLFKGDVVYIMMLLMEKAKKSLEKEILTKGVEIILRTPTEKEVSNMIQQFFNSLN